MLETDLSFGFFVFSEFLGMAEFSLGVGSCFINFSLGFFTKFLNGFFVLFAKELETSFNSTGDVSCIKNFRQFALQLVLVFAKGKETLFGGHNDDDSGAEPQSRGDFGDFLRPGWFEAAKFVQTGLELLFGKVLGGDFFVSVFYLFFVLFNGGFGFGEEVSEASDAFLQLVYVVRGLSRLHLSG